jgi:phage shock protein PspC (stress-responsive transcriptional regulator)
MVRAGAAQDHAPMTTNASLTRSTSDKKLAGVAGGLADYLNVDPLLVRIGFAVSTLFTGAGLVAYAVMWALVPSENAPSAAHPAAA